MEPLGVVLTLHTGWRRKTTHSPGEEERDERAVGRGHVGGAEHEVATGADIDLWHARQDINDYTWHRQRRGRRALICPLVLAGAEGAEAAA